MLPVVMTILGCFPERERSSSFALREEIPLGIINIAVTGWEEVSADLARGYPLKAQAGEKVIAVFVEWSGLDAYSERDGQYFAETYLHNRLELLDSDGFKYSALSAMTKNLYNRSGYGSPLSHNCVVIFHVWVDSKKYILRLQSLEPEGGVDVAIVSLD